MVVNIQGTEPQRRGNSQVETRRRIEHIGQDPHPFRSGARNRISQSRVESLYIQRRAEFDSASSILIDEHLLTGNLEEDISILNIVA